MKITNKQIADVFRRAKEQVFLGVFHYERSMIGGKDRFICCAIDTVTAELNAKSQEAGAVARGIIRERLSPYETLDEWIANATGINIELLEAPAALEKIQVTRHAWLDSLIAEFNSKGK